MLVIKDFATTTTASALTAAATVIAVVDGSKFPSLAVGDYFYAVIQDFYDVRAVEVVKVVGVSGNELSVERGQDGTTGRAFSAGAYVELRLTVRTFAEYIAQSGVVLESLRRSYAGAGYNLVAGSFEVGGKLVNANDVLLHEASGEAFSGPAGNVSAGTNPTLPSSGYVPRSDVVLRDGLLSGALRVRDGLLALRDTISIVDFGAKGNGSATNNLTAITNAIAAANGRTILVPIDEFGGNYAITSGTLTIPETVKLQYESTARIYGSGGSVNDLSKSFTLFAGKTSENRSPGLKVDFKGPLTGTGPGNGSFINQIFIADDKIESSGKVHGWLVDHRFNGGTGGRHASMSRLIQKGPAPNSNIDNNYVAHVSQVICDVANTEESSGSIVFASESYAISNTNTGKVLGVIGAIHEAAVNGTVIPMDRVGTQITSKGASNSWRNDCSISVSSGHGSPSWKDGILFSNVSGSAPIDTTGNAFRFSPVLTSVNSYTFGNIIQVDQNVSFNSVIKLDSSDFEYIINSPRVKLSEAYLDMNLSSSSISLGSSFGNNSPRINFRSGAVSPPAGYDSRIIASGGNGSDYGGTVQVACSMFAIGGTCRPLVDGAVSNGAAATRWSTIYATTGTINTSDASEKTTPLAIDDVVLDAWGDVQLVTFQWLDAVRLKGTDTARWHFGVIAQQVRDAFSARGLDGTRYGLLCYDEWEASDAVFDEDGIVLQEAVEAGNRWGIRSDQCLFLEAAYQRRNYERLLMRVEALESKS